MTYNMLVAFSITLAPTSESYVVPTNCRYLCLPLILAGTMLVYNYNERIQTHLFALIRSTYNRLCSNL